jgi:hypothetical protein
MNSHRQESLTYFLLGLYAIIINWHYNHDVLDAFLAWMFWPIYLIYALVTGDLAHGQWLSIPQSLF